MSKSTSKKNKSDHTTKYFICFIIFFAVGIGLGLFGTRYFLDSKSDTPGEPGKESINDITNNAEYKSTIDNLYGILNANTIFYDSNGLNLEKMDNNTRKKFIYDYLVSNNTYSTTTFDVEDYSNYLCERDFAADIINDEYDSICTITVIPKDDFRSAYKKLLNDDNIDLSIGFYVSDVLQCRSGDDDVYECGRIVNRTGITGVLSVKYSITKVILEPNGDISIYDKGYLVDTRSNIVKPNDGYDNYYLHTSDSTAYYYELKSADNVTFKHTFRLASDNSYYYVSSEVVPKEG